MSRDTPARDAVISHILLDKWPLVHHEEQLDFLQGLLDDECQDVWVVNELWKFLTNMIVEEDLYERGDYDNQYQIHDMALKLARSIESHWKSRSEKR